MKRILIIDPSFDGLDVERSIAGADVSLDVFRPNRDTASLDALRRAEAVIYCRSRHLLSHEMVDKLDNVRIVVQAGVGFNHIDLDACARRGIPVCNTPDYGTREVADHAIGLMLALVRGIPAYDARLQSCDDAWDTRRLSLPPMRRLSKLTFGVVGLGRIGTAAARRAKAFDMNVVFYDPYAPPGQELALGIERAQTLQGLLSRSDVVSLHCPLTTETTQLIDRVAIQAMKPNSILINTSRGNVLDFDALEAALRSGHLCAAALDVLPREPLDRTNSLLAAWTRRESWLEGRLVLTPHAAFYSPESLIDMRRLSMLTAIEFLESETIRSCVNLVQLAREGHTPHHVPAPPMSPSAARSTSD